METTEARRTKKTRSGFNQRSHQVTKLPDLLATATEDPHHRRYDVRHHKRRLADNDGLVVLRLPREGHCQRLSE
jgi:hypothetical protein